ncbi:MAG: hypothetical protein ACRD2R_03045, partial [Terriglobales bacterium]
LRLPDCIALFVFVVCFFGQAMVPRLMLAALASDWAFFWGLGPMIDSGAAVVPVMSSRSKV